MLSGGLYSLVFLIYNAVNFLTQSNQVYKLTALSLFSLMGICAMSLGGRELCASLPAAAILKFIP